MLLPPPRGRTRSAAPVDVLVVCTGNICRSRYVEARLGHAIPGISIGSAGTRPVRGAPPSDAVLRLLVERGVDLDLPPAARRVTGRLIRTSGLIVTAERRHRVDVATLVPDAADRTFTLIELARLLGPNRPVPAHGVQPALDRARRALRDGGDDRDHEDDLADPYGLDTDAFEQMADTADTALSVLVAALDGTGGRL